MAIHYLETHAALEGLVSAEDAEALQHWLQAQAAPAVDLSACEDVHAAALQVLLALQPTLQAPPGNRWLAQALTTA